MYYLLRGEDGSVVGESGTLVAADGGSRTLAAGEAELQALERWTSPTTGAVYPGAWRLALPAEGLELTIEPRLAQQELTHTFSYWEGAVAVTGSRHDRPIRGVGYVELTGYGEAAAARGGAQG